MAEVAPTLKCMTCGAQARWVEAELKDEGRDLYDSWCERHKPARPGRLGFVFWPINGSGKS
jgi:hypothetical protein